MADYTPAANALAGTEQAGALANDERKAAAYNALANTYGVALAGDPDTALKAQKFQQNALTDPIAVQQAQATLAGTNLTNTGLDQTNTYNAAANPLKLTGLKDVNANTEATTGYTQANTNKVNTLLPGEVAQQGATLKQTNAQTGYLGAETAHTNVETQTGRLALNTAQGAQDRTAVMGLLSGLSDTAVAGGDIGAQFDKIAPQIAQFEGVTPDHLAGLRSQLVKDPINTINTLTDSIHGLQMAALGQTKGGLNAAGLNTMVKLGNQQMGLKDGMTMMQSRVEGAQDVATQMQALLPQLASLPTVAKAKAMIPGTPEYQFSQLAHQLTANLSLNDLQAMKSTGLSMGRVTNAEMAAAGNALANVDIGLPTATLATNLAKAQGTFALTNANLKADLQRIGTGGVGGNGHIARAAPAGGVPAGTSPQDIVNELRRRGAVQ